MTYDQAFTEITAGRAEAHALWMLLIDERERDGYGLRAATWEGPGEYQRVSFPNDNLGILVRLPDSRHLPIAKRHA